MINNISNIELENNYEYNCDPDLSFLSTEDINKNIYIYPNPSEDFIHINLNNVFNTIILSDINGREIKSYENSTKIDISFLEDGVYFLNINSTSVKFIKK